MNEQSKKVKLCAIYNAALKYNRVICCAWRLHEHGGPLFLLRFLYLLVLWEEHTKVHRKSMTGSFTRELP